MINNYFHILQQISLIEYYLKTMYFFKRKQDFIHI